MVVFFSKLVCFFNNLDKLLVCFLRKVIKSKLYRLLVTFSITSYKIKKRLFKVVLIKVIFLSNCVKRVTNSFVLQAVLLLTTVLVGIILAWFYAKRQLLLVLFAALIF